MTETLAQMASKLEETFLIYISAKNHFDSSERPLNHTIFTTDKLINLVFDLMNGIKQDEILEGEYKPESEFGHILEIFIKAFRLTAKANDEKVKIESGIILLKTLRAIVEIVNNIAEGNSPNINSKLFHLEDLEIRLNELEKIK
jgi:hypothetical protein